MMKKTSRPVSAVTRRPRRARPRSLAHRLERHFFSCSILAAFSAGSAQAAIQYSGLLGAVTAPLNDDSGLFINVDLGVTQIGGAALAGYDLNFFEQTGTQLLQSRTPSGTAGGVLGFTNGAYNYTRNLAPGAAVGPSGAFLTGSNILGAVDSMGNHGDFAGGVTNGYVGFRFVSPAPGNPMLYGWARVNVTPALELTLRDYAFEDTGGVILAGAVPEPGSLALGCLAAGATGLAVWRGRRRNRENL